MSLFAPDCIGSPSGSVLQQNIRSIICLAPKAADQRSVSQHTITVTSNPSGNFTHYAKHFHGIGTHVYET